MKLGGDRLKGGRGGLEGDRRGVASGTEDNQRRAVVETAVVGDVEFVGVVVATADSCDTGITLDGEAELGVVYNPYLDEMFSAQRGRGAFCNANPIHVSSAPLENALVIGE